MQIDNRVIGRSWNQKYKLSGHCSLGLQPILDWPLNLCISTLSLFRDKRLVNESIYRYICKDLFLVRGGDYRLSPYLGSLVLHKRQPSFLWVEVKVQDEGWHFGLRILRRVLHICSALFVRVLSKDVLSRVLAEANTTKTKTFQTK